MAYVGKFIDRIPYINPAGTRVYDLNQNVANCLNYVNLQEQIDSVLASFPKPLKEYHGDEPTQYDSYCGYQTQVKSLLSPERKSFFQELETELKETAYASYWKREVGTLPDQIPGLPYGMVPEKTTFGRPSTSDETVQTLVNPKITVGEVNLLAGLGHELYKKTHENYFPGEKKNFNNLPDLDQRIFGIKSLAEGDGNQVDKLLATSDSANFMIGPKSLALYKKKNTSKIGKTIEKNERVSSLPLDYTFGRRKEKQKLTVQQILTSSSANYDKNLLNKAIAYINGLRRSIRSQYPPFSFVDFAAAFRNFDASLCDCLPLETFYKINENEGLKLDHTLLELLFNKLGITHGKKNLVNYYGFIKLIDSTQPFPDLGKTEEDTAFTETTYQDSYLNILGKTVNTEQIPAAGLPLGQLQYAYNYLKHQGLIKANMDDYPSTTTVENCLSPGLFPSLGVSHRDFFRPRSKEYIRRIYEKIDVKFPDEVFNKLWREAIRRDGDNVCIETFRNILDEITSAKMEQGAEV